jgi:hypothetical protein
MRHEKPQEDVYPRAFVFEILNFQDAYEKRLKRKNDRFWRTAEYSG